MYISINLRAMNRAIQVQYYGYDCGSLTVLTVSKMNEVMCIVKWAFKLCSNILLLPAHWCSNDISHSHNLLHLLKDLGMWLYGSHTWESWNKTWFKALEIISTSDSTGFLKDIWQMHVIYVNVTGLVNIHPVNNSSSKFNQTQISVQFLRSKI